jgi:hypothetical protein
MLTFTPWIFGLGCLGGLLPDILRLIKNRQDNNLPSYFKRGNFWLGVVLMVGLGGLAAWLLKATDAKEALTLGFAAPQVISSLAAGTGKAGTGKAGTGKVVEREDMDIGKFGLRRWWAS